MSKTSRSLLHPKGSVYTVRHAGTDVRSQWKDKIGLGAEDLEPNAFGFTQAVIEFRDDGAFVNGAQLGAATQCIRQARSSAKNRNGALVVLFIHGWHHTAAWNPATGDGDFHFGQFREMLRSLTLREAERYSQGRPAGRHVIGVFLGWSGDRPDSWLRNIPILKHLSFYDRIGSASDIGGAKAVVDTVRDIVLATKGPLNGKSLEGQPESPIILIGHSMGALILESAFLSLLNEEGEPLAMPSSSPNGCVEVRKDGKLVHFPDLLLALNSAADSAIAKKIVAALERKRFQKSIKAGYIQYSAPVFISTTSVADRDTKFTWRIAHLLDPSHRTDGHDSSLFTHELTLKKKPVQSTPKGFIDFGQDWHSLRGPMPLDAATPTFWIDLPSRKRKGRRDFPTHERYELAPRKHSSASHLAWVFQLPQAIGKNHNDIFNFRARLFTLALMQISGAVVSLASDFRENFESI